jgi:hypothetical protein
MERGKEIKKTVIPMFFGMISGSLSFFLGGGSPFFKGGILLLILAILLQHPVFSNLGIELGKKDWAYLSFLTFILWFITWTFLLS